MKGVILAGGKGTRMLPATRVINKHMIPILNKPMIMYPLETLKALGVDDVMIITGGNHIGGTADFLGDGSEFGMQLNYRIQKDAGGIAQALALAKNFVGSDRVAVILGDNIYDNTLLPTVDTIDPSKAVLFVQRVPDPERFGVYSDIDGVKTIEEKPKEPKSNMAVTGLYIYPSEVFDVIPTLTPSARGELEITDVNTHFVKNDNCVILEIPGFWSDAGTPESLKDVTNWAYDQQYKTGEK